MATWKPAFSYLPLWRYETVSDPFLPHISSFQYLNSISNQSTAFKKVIQPRICVVKMEIDQVENTLLNNGCRRRLKSSPSQNVNFGL